MCGVCPFKGVGAGFVMLLNQILLIFIRIPENLNRKQKLIYEIDVNKYLKYLISSVELSPNRTTSFG